ncbi:cell wall-binding repeat-containing protein [Peptostreptococcus porci]|uniref:cell wall-binding repeat-containing protein n=1 Tax=Peptostreptococcus porci TaxID=2652282 RepID=UPI0023EFD03E|nr:cell wall-binding repeat-containing protein [Peptostreptococcus porci]MDD7182076.1 cell wall-binding repeat-containing protein [Peptostreptococcus porci]MDY4127336.1 cell wall-binding repeat-containing protein [Peptostreptococcus porci]
MVNKKKNFGMAMAAIISMTAISPVFAADVSKTKIDVERIGGKDRLETSLKILERVGSKKVNLVNGNQFADALSIAPIAAINGEGIVLINENKLPDVENTFKKQGVKDITLIGGEQSISNNTYTNLSKAFKVNRISGKDRYETSQSVVSSTGKSDIGVATGTDFPDALSAGALLAKKQMPLLLVDGKKQSALPSGLKGVYTFGGKASVANEFGKRIAGKDRYETSLKIAEEFGNSDVVILTSGKNFADALAAAPLAKKVNAPIILIEGNKLSKESEKIIEKAKKVIVIGGESSISENVINTIRAYENKVSPINNFTNSNSTSPSSPQSKVKSVNIKSEEFVINKNNDKYVVTGKMSDKVKLVADVVGINLKDSDKKVSWELVGAYDAKTSISDGVLTISEDEEKSPIVVKAISEKDRSVYSMIEILNPVVENIEITGEPEHSVKPGTEIKLNAKVTGVNLENLGKDLEWLVDEESSKLIEIKSKNKNEINFKVKDTAPADSQIYINASCGRALIGTIIEVGEIEKAAPNNNVFRNDGMNNKIIINSSDPVAKEWFGDLKKYYNKKVLNEGSYEKNVNISTAKGTELKPEKNANLYLNGYKIGNNGPNIEELYMYSKNDLKDIGNTVTVKIDGWKPVTFKVTKKATFGGGPIFEVE